MSDLVERRVFASLLIVVKNRIWSYRRIPLAQAVWAPLTIFCKYFLSRCWLILSSVLIFCLMIWSWSVAKASANTGVAGVPSGKSPWQGASTATLALVDSTTSVRGFIISLSTLSGLNGNKPHAANPVKMLLRVNALSLAALYNVVKCSLLITFTPPRSRRSTCSR